TRKAFEDVVAELEEGVAAFAFSSGMAAIAASLKLFQFGDHVIVTEGLYGHTFSLMQNLIGPTGVKLRFVDTSDQAAIEAAWTERTAGLFVEMPTNPLLKGTD